MKPQKTRFRDSKRRSKKPPLDEGWYSIRGILDEREAAGRVEYLVDWEDNIDTGEAYVPTWIWSHEVTDEARDEWEQTKAARNRTETRPEVCSEDGEDNRPLNWRQLQRAKVLFSTQPRSSSADSNDRPHKTLRFGFSAAPSEEPVPSVTSSDSLDSVPVSDPAARGHHPDAGAHAQLLVELPKDPHLHLAGYLSASHSHNSLSSSHTLAELEDSDERLALASQLSRQTVPDSQELSGPTWSQAQATGPTATPEGTAHYTTQPAVARPLGSPPTDIPSRQPEQSEPSGSGLPSIGSRTRSDSPRAGIRPETPRQTSVARDTSGLSPVFASQPPLQYVFDLPESSSQPHVPAPSSGSPIKAPAIDKSQSSTAGHPQTGQASTESQDAQVVSRDDSSYRADHFSSSNSDVRPPPFQFRHATASSGEHENTSLEDSLRSSATDKMELEKPGEPRSSDARLSVAEELSKLFSFDNPIADPVSTNSRTEQQQPVFESSLQLASSAPPPAPIAESAQSMTGAALTSSDAPRSNLLVSQTASLAQHATVSPADISMQTESEKAALQSLAPLPSQDLTTLGDSSQAPPPMAQPPREQTTSQDSTKADADVGQREYIITLPFQASRRPFYDEVLLEYRDVVSELSIVFNSEIYFQPEESLVHKVDQLLSQLYNICDFPPDAVGTNLEKLPPSQLARYSCDANSKFNFVFELLQGLRRDSKVVIIARSAELLRLLSNLMETAKVEYMGQAIGKQASNLPASASRVILALPGESIVDVDIDIVIGFDHAFPTSMVSKKLFNRRETSVKKPLVLALVTTHSIEHIDLHVPENMCSLERKNALLSGIVRARTLVSDPDRGYPEPHELAGIFLDYLNGDADVIAWEPQELPDDVLDIFLNAQSSSEMFQSSMTEREDGCKRKHDDYDDDARVKRKRSLALKEPPIEESEPPLPDDVRSMLKSAAEAETSIKSGGLQVRMPLAVLQTLAEKNAECERKMLAQDAEAEYQAVLLGLEKRIEEYERTTDMIYKSHRKALKDRTKFEADKQKAEAALRTAQESAQKDSEKAQKRIAELEETVARLTADPRGRDRETPLARMSRLLKEAESRAQMLEKRLENAQKDGEYIRASYQEASSLAIAKHSENAELQEQIDKLGKRSGGLVKIHKIQAESNTQTLLGVIQGLKTQVKDRERELDRVREEFRQLRNGRRETRQVSVPRSPRTGMMSPRHGRPFGGSASRGTSPAPAPSSDNMALGMQFMSAQ